MVEPGFVGRHLESYLQSVAALAQTTSQPDIQAVVDVLFDVWQRRKTVFVMGNGGSAATASHFVCDLAKMTIVNGQPRFRVLGLGDNAPLISAWTNDSGFSSIFAEQLEPWLEEGDVLVGFSVHGGSGAAQAGPWSQNLVRAMHLAKERGAKVIGFSGFDGGLMKEMADVCLVVPAESEPLGTALVESFHVVLAHLICTALSLKIAEQAHV